MDANQDSLANPYGMDTECENCPGLCETRENVLHGYGDVGGDFIFVAERPHAGADQTGVPLPAMMPVVIYKRFSDNLGLHEHLRMRMNQIFKMRFSRM